MPALARGEERERENFPAKERRVPGGFSSFFFNPSSSRSFLVLLASASSIRTSLGIRTTLARFLDEPPFFSLFPFSAFFAFFSLLPEILERTMRFDTTLFASEFSPSWLSIASREKVID